MPYPHSQCELASELHIQACVCVQFTYFFGYKTEFFSFLNNPKNLDPSYKMDLDLWDCLGRVECIT